MPRTEEIYRQIRDGRRNHILLVAQRLFLKKGLANLKIGELARASAMSQGLLYRYFPNKQEVFSSVVDKATASLSEQFQDALKVEGNATHKLLWLTEHLLGDIRKNPGRHQIILQALAQPGKTQAMIQKVNGVMRTVLRRLIVEGQAEGGIADNDPDSLVILFLSTFQGLASGLFFFHSDDEHFPKADLIFQMFRR